MLSISASRIQTPTHPPTPTHTHPHLYIPTHTHSYMHTCRQMHSNVQINQLYFTFSCFLPGFSPVSHGSGAGREGWSGKLGVFSFLVRNCDGGGGHLPVSHGPLRAEWEGICVPSIRCVATPGCVGLLTTPPLH